MSRIGDKIAGLWGGNRALSLDSMGLPQIMRELSALPAIEAHIRAHPAKIDIRYLKGDVRVVGIDRSYDFVTRRAGSHIRLVQFKSDLVSCAVLRDASKRILRLGMTYSPDKEKHSAMLKSVSKEAKATDVLRALFFQGESTIDITAVKGSFGGSIAYAEVVKPVSSAPIWNIFFDPASGRVLYAESNRDLTNSGARAISYIQAFEI